MAISDGQRFVRRQSSARTAIDNESNSANSFDTAVLSEGGYSWASNQADVDTAGKYLAIHGTGEVRESGQNRALGRDVLTVNGASQGIHGATTHRYVRRSGGADENASLGATILDLAANDDVGSEVAAAAELGGTYDRLGEYDTNADSGAGLQLIKLPDGDFLKLERSSDQAIATSNINATRPWGSGSGSWTKLTWPTETTDDGGWHAAGSGDVVLPANSKFLICYTLGFYSTDSSRHQYLSRLSIDGTLTQYLSGYHRNTSSQGAVITGMILVETGGTAETFFVEATQESEGADAGTGQFQDGSLTILELPSSAEWIHVDNGATDSLTSALAATGTWYTTPLSSTVRADGGSDLSLDAANDAVQNDSGGSLPVLALGWLHWDRDTGSSGTRKVPTSRISNGGSAVLYGWGAEFNRGQQSGDDTWHAGYICAATFDAAASADITFETIDRASGSNADMGVYASGLRGFLGFQVLNLDSLTGGGSGQTVNLGIASDAGSAQPVSPSGGPVSVAMGLPSSAASALALTASPGGVSVPLGLPSEAASALSLSPVGGAASVALGLAADVGSALGLAPAAGGVTVALGLPSDAASVLAMTPLSTQTVALGIASDIASALSLVPSGGPVTVPVGFASDSGTALALTVSAGPVSVALGQPSTSGSALPLSVVPGGAVVALGLPSDAGTAMPSVALAGGATVALGLASDVASALGLTASPGGVVVGLGLPFSTASALGISPSVGGQTVVLGIAADIASAPALTAIGGPSTVGLGVAADTGSALPLGVIAGAVTRAIGIASSVSSARPLIASAGGVTVALGQAADLASVLPVTALAGGASVPLGIAADTSVALAMAPTPAGVVVALGLPSDVGTALAITGLLTVDPVTGKPGLIIAEDIRGLAVAEDIRGLTIAADPRGLVVVDDVRGLLIADDVRGLVVEA